MKTRFLAFVMMVLGSVLFMNQPVLATQVDSIVVTATQADSVAKDTSKIVGMNSGDLLELELAKLELQKAQFEPASVAIVVPVALFCISALIVFLVLFFRYKAKQDKMRVLEKAIEAGKDLPESFFEEKKNRVLTPTQRMFQGIAQICLGVGLVIALYGMLEEVAFACSIPAFIGIGNVIIATLEMKKERKASKSDEGNSEKE